MIKKLGDMTIKELKKEQDKICGDTNCEKCPFKECCVTHQINLEQEVEIEEWLLEGGIVINHGWTRSNNK